MGTMKAQLIIRKVIVSGDWTADIEFPNDAKLWCNNKVNGHYEWFIDAGSFLNPAYPSHCNGNVCTVTAHFQGWHGVAVCLITCHNFWSCAAFRTFEVAGFFCRV